MDNGLYRGEVITSIMVFDRSIKGVKHIELIGIFPYSKQNDKKIADLIKSGNIEAMAQLADNELEQNNGYDLMVYKFLDDKDILKAAIVYDSDDLWQDPQTLELFIL